MTPDKVLFKIALLGDTCTGKTYFMHRLKGKVIPAYQPTRNITVIGLEIPSRPELIAQVFDTPGDPQRFSIAKSKAIDCQAVLIFVDNNNRHTFDKAKIFVKDLAIFEMKRKISKKQMADLIQLSSCGKMFSSNQEPKKIIEQICSFVWRAKAHQQPPPVFEGRETLADKSCCLFF